MAVQPDGKIVVGARTGNGDMVIARYTPGFGVDTAFGTSGDGRLVVNFGGRDVINDLVVDPRTGKIYGVGSSDGNMALFRTRAG